MRALGAQRRRAQELALWTAWHAAALARTEPLPDLAPLLDRVARGEGRDEQSPEDQMNAARVIAAAFSHLPEAAAEAGR